VPLAGGSCKRGKCATYHPAQAIALAAMMYHFDTLPPLHNKHGHFDTFAALCPRICLFLTTQTGFIQSS
jgi:hypothetical protein